jgi:hypothetical protein
MAEVLRVILILRRGGELVLEALTPIPLQLINLQMKFNL